MADKIPALLKTHVFTRVDDFADKSYVHVTRRAGGQMYQYYALTIPKGLEPTFYRDAEVIFSREIYKRVVYSTTVFPLYFQEGINCQAQASTTRQSYFGQRVLPQNTEVVEMTAKLKRLIVRNMLKIAGAPADRIEVSASVLKIRLRPAYLQIYGTRKEKENLAITAKLKRVKMKIGLILSNMAEAPESVDFKSIARYYWKGTKRPFAIAKGVFVSARDLAPTSRLHIQSIDPFGASIDPSDNSFRTVTKRSGLQIRPGKYVAVTVPRQPWAVSFDFKAESLDGVLLEGNSLFVQLENGNTLSGNLNGFAFSHPVELRLQDWNRFTIEKTYSGADATPAGSVTLRINNNFVARQDDVEALKPLFPNTLQNLYLMNGSSKDKALVGRIKDFKYIVGSLADLETREEATASDMHIEGTTIVDPYNNWLSPVEVKFRDNALLMDGSYYIYAENRDDLTINDFNNYRMEVEFTPTLQMVSYKPTQFIVYQKSGHTASERHPNEYRAGYEIYLTKGSHADKFKINVQINSTFTVLPIEITVNERCKVEVVKHKKSLYFFVNDVRVSVVRAIGPYIDGYLERTILGVRPTENNSEFVGLIHRFKAINYYLGDDRLEAPIADKDTVFLKFNKEELVDLGDPSREWQVEGYALDTDHGRRYIRPSDAFGDSLIKWKDTQGVFELGTGDFTLELSTEHQGQVRLLPWTSDRNLEIRDRQILMGSTVTSTSDLWVNPTVTISRKDSKLWLYANGFLVHENDEALKDLYLKLSEGDSFVRFPMINKDRAESFVTPWFFRLTKGKALFHTLDRIYNGNYGAGTHNLSSLDPNIYFRIDPLSYVYIKPSIDYVDRGVLSYDTIVKNNQSSGVVLQEDRALGQQLFKLEAEEVLQFEGTQATLDIIYQGATPLALEGFSFPSEGLNRVSLVWTKNSLVYLLNGIYQTVKSYEENPSITLNTQATISSYRMVKGVALYTSTFNNKLEVFREGSLTLTSHFSPEPAMVEGKTRKLLSLPRYLNTFTIKPNTSDVLILKPSKFVEESYWIYDQENLNTSPAFARLMHSNNYFGAARKIHQEPRDRTYFAIISKQVGKAVRFNLPTMDFWNYDPKSGDFSNHSNTSYHSHSGDKHSFEMGSASPFGLGVSVAAVDGHTGKAIGFTGSGKPYSISQYHQGYNPDLVRCWNNFERFQAYSTGNLNDTPAFGIWTTYDGLRPLNLAFTDRFSILPFTGGFVETNLETLGERAARVEHRGVVDKQAIYVPKHSHLSLNQMQVKQGDLCFESWIMIKSAGSGSIFKLSNGSVSIDVVLRGNHFVINDQQVPYYINTNVHYHLRLEITSQIAVYVNGLPLSTVQLQSAELEGEWSIQINTEDKETNSEMMLDDLKMTALAFGEVFDSLLSLREATPCKIYVQNITNTLRTPSEMLTSTLIASAEIGQVIDPSQLAVPENGIESVLRCDLRPYSGIAGNMMRFSFKHDYQQELLVVYRFRSKGQVLREVSDRAKAEEHPHITYLNIPNESTDELTIHFMLQAGGMVSSFEMLMEQPQFQGDLKQDRDIPRFARDERSHIIRVLDSDALSADTKQQAFVYPYNTDPLGLAVFTIEKGKQYRYDLSENKDIYKVDLETGTAELLITLEGVLSIKGDADDTATYLLCHTQNEAFLATITESSITYTKTPPNLDEVKFVRTNGEGYLLYRRTSRLLLRKQSEGFAQEHEISVLAPNQKLKTFGVTTEGVLGVYLVLEDTFKQGYDYVDTLLTKNSMQKQEDSNGSSP